MVEDDVLPAVQNMYAAFEALARARGEPPRHLPPGEDEWGRVRIAHILATDPGGCWVAEEAGKVVGVALAIVREGVWGLSLLTVDPARQSAGLGRALLEASLAYGRGCRGAIILASPDPRAMRRYALAGFRLLPAVGATGVPALDRLPDPGDVRPGGDADLELCDRASRAVRGAAHGADVDAMRRTGGRLLVAPGKGFVIHRDGSPRLLAALDEESAARLLAGALREAPAGKDVEVGSLTAGQDWAIGVALAVGLRLGPWGPAFTRGELGPLVPYIPSGAYL
jgi:GNAT superfamily N-acetyltransferase